MFTSSTCQVPFVVCGHHTDRNNLVYLSVSVSITLIKTKVRLANDRTDGELNQGKYLFMQLTFKGSVRC